MAFHHEDRAVSNETGELEGNGDLSEWDYLTRTFDREDFFEDRSTSALGTAIGAESLDSVHRTAESTYLPSVYVHYPFPSAAHRHSVHECDLRSCNEHLSDASRPAHLSRNRTWPEMSILPTIATGHLPSGIDHPISHDWVPPAMMEGLLQNSQQPQLMGPMGPSSHFPNRIRSIDSFTPAAFPNSDIPLHYRSKDTLNPSEDQNYVSLAHPEHQINKHPIGAWRVPEVLHGSLDFIHPHKNHSLYEQVTTRSDGAATRSIGTISAAPSAKRAKNLPALNSDRSFDSSRSYVVPPNCETSSGDYAPALPPHSLLKPLTAYNYFYRDERDNIVQGISSDFDPLPDPVHDFRDINLQKLLDQRWYVDPTKQKRVHRKSHGKLGFEKLSKLIAQRWHALPKHGQEFYRRVARADDAQYQRHLERPRAASAAGDIDNESYKKNASEPSSL